MFGILALASLTCPAGNYLSDDLLFCRPCPPGSASSVVGAISPLTCGSCYPGFFAGAAGSLTCQPCAYDTWSNLGVGDYGATACFACPSGTLTSFRGSSSPSSCLARSDAALAGTRFPGAPPDHPHRAAAGDSFLPGDTGCGGHPTKVLVHQSPQRRLYGANGSASVPPYILFDAPLFNFGNPATPTLPLGDGGSIAVCTLLNTLATNVQPTPGRTKSRSRALFALGVGGIVVLVLIGIFLFAVLNPGSTLSRCCYFTAHLIPPLDQLPPLGKMEIHLFYLLSFCRGKKRVEKKDSAEEGGGGEDGFEPQNTLERCCAKWSPKLEEDDVRPSGTGLICTLVLGALLSMYCAYSFMKWKDNNINETVTLVALDGTLDFVVKPPPQRTSTVGGIPGVSGLTLRFFVDGEKRRCRAPLSIMSNDYGQVPIPPASDTTFQPPPHGGWVMAPPTTCGNALKQLNQFTLFCPACKFSATSSLAITMDYTCQSILAEAAAVRAYPGDTLSFARQTASATPDGTLLDTVTWTLPLFLTDVTDLASDIPPPPDPKAWLPSFSPKLFDAGGNFSGFLIASDSIYPGSGRPISSVNGSSSPVILLIDTPLQSAASLTTLEQGSELFDAIGNIVGFFPAAFGTTIIALLFLKSVLSVCYRVEVSIAKKNEGHSEGGTGEAKESSSSPARGATPSTSSSSSSASTSAAFLSAGDAALTFSIPNPLSRILPTPSVASSEGKMSEEKSASAAIIGATQGKHQPYHQLADESQHAHVHLHSHEDIPRSGEAIAAAAATYGCNVATVNNAIAALLRDEVPDEWGFEFVEEGNDIIFFASDGTLGDPRDNFSHYLETWVTHEKKK